MLRHIMLSSSSSGKPTRYMCPKICAPMKPLTSCIVI